MAKDGDNIVVSTKLRKEIDAAGKVSENSALLRNNIEAMSLYIVT